MLFPTFLESDRKRRYPCPPRGRNAYLDIHKMEGSTKIPILLWFLCEWGFFISSKKKHLLLVFLCHPFGHVTAFANDQVLNLLQQMDLSIDRHALDIPLEFLVAAWKVEAADLDFEVPAVYVAGWWEIQKNTQSFWSFLLFFPHDKKVRRKFLSESENRIYTYYLNAYQLTLWKHTEAATNILTFKQTHNTGIWRPDPNLEFPNIFV